LVFVLILGQAGFVGAQQEIHLQSDRVTMNYPDGIHFELAASSDSVIEEVVLRYGTEIQSCQESIAQVQPDFEPAEEVNVEWDLEFLRSGALPPGASLWWQWELRDAAGNTLVTDKQTIEVQDQRHSWKELSEGELSLQWYEGDTAWGRKLLNMAVESLDRLEQEIGGRPPGTIWVVAYPSAEALREALVTSQEWTGAVAFTQFGAILISAPRESEDWLRQALPHELIHLALEKLTFNCQGVTAPSWLGEGLAERAEGGYDETSLDSILEALEAGDLLPLKFLEGSFPAQGMAARLAYGQSYYVVSYLIDQYGAEKMGDLLAALQSGLLIDDALSSVYGFDTYGLDAAWRESLGFEAGDQPPASPGGTATRTAIPTLALWTAIVSATPAPTATPPAGLASTDTPAPAVAAISSPVATSTALQAVNNQANSVAASESEALPGQVPVWIWLLAGAGGLILILFIVFQVKKRSVK
jgi:hypothetical protein